MIIFRYLAKEIFATLLAATLVLLVIFVTNQSVQFLDRAASGQLPATVLFQLIALQIPLLLGYLLPLGLYLGVLLTFGRLHIDSEMTVLSSCGVSRAKLTTMALGIAMVVAVIVAWLMAIVVPKAQGDINYIFNKAAVTASVAKVIPGRFMTFGSGKNQIVFYTESVKDHAVMHDVFMATKVDSDPPVKRQAWTVIASKTAQEKKVPGQPGQFLVFDHGHRYTGIPGEKKYQVVKFNEYGVRLTTGKMRDANAVQYYSMSKLWSLSPGNRKAAAELQWRMAMPISAILFTLLAMPLCEVRPRYGKLTQLFPAMLIYLGYADLIFLARAWIRSGQLSPELGMWWIHGAALLLALLMMLYRVGWHRIRHFFAGMAKS